MSMTEIIILQGNLFNDQHVILRLTFKNYEEGEEVTQEQRQPSCHFSDSELLVINVRHQVSI